MFYVSNQWDSQTLCGVWMSTHGPQLIWDWCRKPMEGSWFDLMSGMWWKRFLWIVMCNMQVWFCFECSSTGVLGTRWTTCNKIYKHTYEYMQGKALYIRVAAVTYIKHGIMRFIKVLEKLNRRGTYLKCVSLWRNAKGGPWKGDLVIHSSS